MRNISDLSRYLSEYLRSWIQKTGITQADAAELLGIDPGQLSGLLKQTRGISLPSLEKIAQATGKSAIDALLMGRELLGEGSENKDDIQLDSGAVEAFKICLSAGGEAAEILTQSILELALRKRSQAKINQEKTAAKKGDSFPSLRTAARRPEDGFHVSPD